MRRILGSLAVALSCVAAGVVLLSTTPAHAATVTVGANREILVDGQPFLPIMQWLQSSSRIAYQKGLGINTFVGNGGGDTSAEYLAECQAQGVWCVMDPGDMSVSGHGSLLGWIFGDEPDLDSNQTEPATLLTQYQTIKAADPSHITFMTLTSGFFSEMDPPTWMNGDRSRYLEYPNATDAVGFDLYPLYGWCQPDWLYRVGASHEELASTYAPTRATYQWIECVRTSSQWCDLSERLPDDGPYPEEVRNEVWQAIAHGATAIGYFTHSWECPDYTQFCLSPAQETELTRTNGQLTALTVPILSPRYEQTVTVTPATTARVDSTAKRVGAEVYLFAVNVERSAVDVTFTVPGLLAGSSVEVYDEARTLTSTGEAFTDTFESLGVHIYVVQVGAGPEPDGGTGGSGAAGGGTGTGGSGAAAGASVAGPGEGPSEGCSRPRLVARGARPIAGSPVQPHAGVRRARPSLP